MSKVKFENVSYLNFGFDLTFELWNLTFSLAKNGGKYDASQR